MSLAGLLTDPVRRRWVLGRLRGRWANHAAPAGAPYQDALPEAETPDGGAFAEYPSKAPRKMAGLDLPGGPLTLKAGDAAKLFHRSLPETTLKALDAFAWLPGWTETAWGAALWQGWSRERGENGAMAHEIAASRLVAWLDFARRNGLPAPKARSIDQLVAQGRRIANDLATNRPVALIQQGHALFRLGLDLTMPGMARLGLLILEGEGAARIRPSGLVSGSTTIQLLLARSYADCWLAARRRRHPAAPRLEALLARLLAAIPPLLLPGGLPLVGDVPGFLPPGELDGLVRGQPIDCGWTGRLDEEDRAALLALRQAALLTDLELMVPDGWLRRDLAGWAGLWHVEPDGWPRWPSHQDLGAAELHHRGLPLFVDAGGAWGQGLDSAALHGGLTLGDAPALPDDRLRYDESFRREVAGGPPRLRTEWDGASLSHDGFSRLGGPKTHLRRWRFGDAQLAIEDNILGTGRYVVTRRLLTPLAVSREDDGSVRLEGGDRRYRLAADMPWSVDQTEGDLGWGRTRPLRRIVLRALVNLPWRGRIEIRCLPERDKE